MAPYDNLLLSCGGGVISSHSQSDVYKDEANLCIGLGGTGMKALVRLKQKIYQQIRPDDPSSAIPTYGNIRFLAVDSDATESKGSGKAKLDGDDLFPIKDDTLKLIFSGDGKTQVKRDPTLNWMNIDAIDTQINPNGAGGVRQIGRYLLMKKSKELRKKIEQKCTDALQHATGGGRLNIYIFAGISGGTGSGTFIDTCYIVRDVLKANGWDGTAQVFGFFFLPDVATSIPEVQKTPGALEYNQRNGYAAMKELDYLMDLKDNQDIFIQKYDGFDIETNEPPVDLCFLVSATKSDGNPIPNAFNYCINVATDFVLSFMVEVTLPAGVAAGAGDGGITWRGLMANIAAGVGSIPTDCGVNRCYQILGASDAEIPITQISTYLACGFYRKFDSLVDRQAVKGKITQQGIDKLADELDLTANKILNKVNANCRQLMLPDPDMKTLRDIGPCSIGSTGSGVQIPSLWDAPGHKWESNNSGVRKENESAICRDLQGKDPYDARQYIAGKTQSIITDTFLHMLQYCRSSNLGPYYAAAMLHNTGYDLVSAIDGAIDTLQKNLKHVKDQIDGVDGLPGIGQAIAEASEKFCKGGLFSPLTEKSRYEDYKDAVSQWFACKDQINQLDTAIRVLQQVKEELKDLYTHYFAPLTEMLDRLHDTFIGNEEFLSNKALVQPAGTYTTQILSVNDIQGTLDNTIAGLTEKVAVTDFMDAMLDRHKEWINRDEEKIGALVSKYLNDVFQEQLGTTLTAYLQIKFPKAVGPGALSQAIADNIIEPVYDASLPMFWCDPNFKVESSTFMTGVVTVPQVATDVCTAAQNFFTKKSTSNTVRETDIKDRIFEIRLSCGVPLYAYQGVQLMYDEYQKALSKSVAGVHLYEKTGRGYEEDKMDWSTYLPNPAPYSKAPKLNSGAQAELKRYKEAEDKNFIQRLDGTEWLPAQLDEKEKKDLQEYGKVKGKYCVHECAPVKSKSFTLHDFLKPDAQGRTQFDGASYIQTLNQIQDQIDHPQSIRNLPLRSDGDPQKGYEIWAATRRDNFLRYPVLQNIVRKNLAGRAELEEERAQLKSIKAEYDQYQEEIHSFALLLFEGSIRSEDAQARESFERIKKLTYKYLFRGVEEKAAILTDTTDGFPYGRNFPLYQAFCTYRSFDAARMPKSEMLKKAADFDAKTLVGRDARLARKLEMKLTPEKIGSIADTASLRADDGEIMRFYYGLADELASYRDKFDPEQWKKDYDAVPAQTVGKTAVPSQKVTLYGNGKYLYVYPQKTLLYALDEEPPKKWVKLDPSMQRWDGTKWLPVQLDAKGQILL